VLTGEMRRNPHVQSYVVATDQVRLVLVGAGQGIVASPTGRQGTLLVSGHISTAALVLITDWHHLNPSADPPGCDCFPCLPNLADGAGAAAQGRPRAQVLPRHPRRHLVRCTASVK